MRKIISTLIIIAALALFAGCNYVSDVSDVNDNAVDKSSMFVRIESCIDWTVVYHKETRVMYAVSNASYNRGNFTLLVNADGSPLLYEE